MNIHESTIFIVNCPDLWVCTIYNTENLKTDSLPVQNQNQGHAGAE